VTWISEVGARAARARRAPLGYDFQAIRPDGPQAEGAAMLRDPWRLHVADAMT
jgi:hypothetical protein